MTDPARGPFRGTVQSVNAGRGAAVAIPYDVRAVFGQARPPVRVTPVGIPDMAPWRTTVSVYGGVAWIGLRKDQLAALGAESGSEVQLLVERDDEPRVVVAPPELRAGLAADVAARTSYEALSYSHRREYARWVESAGRQETRDCRATEALRLLREGVRTPDNT